MPVAARDALNSAPFDVIYRRFAVAGALLIVLPIILLLPDRSRDSLAGLGMLFLPAGALVAVSAAWTARGATYDWRVRILVSGVVLMLAVAVGMLFQALSAREGDIPDVLRLGFLAVTVLFPTLAFSFAGWWFLWAWRRRGS